MRLDKNTKSCYIKRYNKRANHSLIFLPYTTRIRVIWKVGGLSMKRYQLSELIKKWEREELTAEQAIGQILLWLNLLSERVTKVEATPQKPQLPENS